MKKPYIQNHIYSYEFKAHFSDKILSFRVFEETEAEAFETAADSINVQPDDVPTLELVCSKINHNSKASLGMEFGIKVQRKKAV